MNELLEWNYFCCVKYISSAISVTYEVIKASVKKSRQSSKHKQMQYNNKTYPS